MWVYTGQCSVWLTNIILSEPHKNPGRRKHYSTRRQSCPLFLGDKHQSELLAQDTYCSITSIQPELALASLFFSLKQSLRTWRFIPNWNLSHTPAKCCNELEMAWRRVGISRPWLMRQIDSRVSEWLERELQHFPLPMTCPLYSFSVLKTHCCNSQSWPWWPRQLLYMLNAVRCPSLGLSVGKQLVQTYLFV